MSLRAVATTDRGYLHSIFILWCGHFWQGYLCPFHIEAHTYNYLFVQPDALLLTAPATGEALSTGERQKWKRQNKFSCRFLVLLLPLSKWWIWMFRRSLQRKVLSMFFSLLSHCINQDKCGKFWKSCCWNWKIFHSVAKKSINMST